MNDLNISQSFGGPNRIEFDMQTVSCKPQLQVLALVKVWLGDL